MSHVCIGSTPSFCFQNSRYVVTENADEMYSVPLVTPNIDIEVATEVCVLFPNTEWYD